MYWLYIHWPGGKIEEDATSIQMFHSLQILNSLAAT